MVRDSGSDRSCRGAARGRLEPWLNPSASARGLATADARALEYRERMGFAEDAQVVPGDALVAQAAPARRSRR